MIHQGAFQHSVWVTCLWPICWSPHSGCLVVPCMHHSSVAHSLPFAKGYPMGRKLTLGPDVRDSSHNKAEQYLCCTVFSTPLPCEVAVIPAVMVHPLTLHVPPKPCLHLQQLVLFLNLSDQPLTHLGLWPMSHSLSWTLVCSYYLSLLDILNSPCLPFDLQPSALPLASCPQLLDSISDSLYSC